MEGAIAKVNVAMIGSWSELADVVVKEESIDAETQCWVNEIFI